MNQRADLLKKNLPPIVAKPLIYLRGWLLSHTTHRSKGRKQLQRGVDRVADESPGAFCALAGDPLALDPAEQPRQGLSQYRDVLREQKESERQHPQSQHRQKAEKTARDQQNGQRNPHQPRRWLAYPTDKSGRPRRQFALKPGKMPVEFLLALIHQGLTHQQIWAGRIAARRQPVARGQGDDHDERIESAGAAESVFLGLPGFARLGGAGSGFSGFDGKRHSRPHRRHRAGIRRTEIDPAARRKLRLVPDHASRHPIDVGDLGTADAKRIVSAGLLLFGRVSFARGREHRKRERQDERSGPSSRRTWWRAGTCLSELRALFPRTVFWIVVQRTILGKPGRRAHRGVVPPLHRDANSGIFPTPKYRVDVRGVSSTPSPSETALPHRRSAPMAGSSSAEFVVDLRTTGNKNKKPMKTGAKTGRSGRI